MAAQKITFTSGHGLHRSEIGPLRRDLTSFADRKGQDPLHHREASSESLFARTGTPDSGVRE